MKSFRVTGFSLVVMVAVAGTAHAAIDDGLVSYWPFDGNLNDLLTLNNGTLVGASTTPAYAAGKFGQAIDLDGVDQYVDVGNGSSLDMDLTGAGAQTGSVSISAWFRVDGFGKDWQALVAKGEGSAYRVARRGGSNVMSYAGGVGDIPTADTIGPSVNDGALHHVVAITENAVSTRLWVDGTLVDTGGVPTIVNDGNGNARNPVNPPLYIGDNPQTGNRTWNGLIDDVAIWNRPLLDSEILAMWNGGAGASLGTLIDPNSAPVPGDVNGDRQVNNADFEIIRGNFLNAATTREEGDLNRDGVVNFSDFRLWTNNVPGGGGAASVPEPAIGFLAAAALLLNSRGARRPSLRRRIHAPYPLNSL